MAISSNDALSVLRRFTDEGRPVLVIGVSKTCLSLFTGSLAQLTDEAVILQHAGTLGIGLVVSFSNVTSFDFADVREFTKFISPDLINPQTQFFIDLAHNATEGLLAFNFEDSLLVFVGLDFEQLPHSLQSRRT